MRRLALRCQTCAGHHRIYPSKRRVAQSDHSDGRCECERLACLRWKIARHAGRIGRARVTALDSRQGQASPRTAPDPVERTSKCGTPPDGPTVPGECSSSRRSRPHQFHHMSPEAKQRGIRHRIGLRTRLGRSSHPDGNANSGLRPDLQNSRRLRAWFRAKCSI
jgi:hypothetical protein